MKPASNPRRFIVPIHEDIAMCFPRRDDGPVNVLFQTSCAPWGFVPNHHSGSRASHDARIAGSKIVINI